MTIAPPYRQLGLFYLPPRLDCDSNASARNAYGAAAMEIVCRTLNLNPIRINGNFDACLDAEKDGTFYEIKSVHKNSKVVLYDFRLRKERQTKLPIKYILLIHGLRNARENILDAMLATAPRIVILDLAFVVACAASEPLRKIKSKKRPKRDGYSRNGYAEGYRNVPVKRFFEMPHQLITEVHI